MEARIVLGVIIACVALAVAVVLWGLAGTAMRPLANVTVARVLYSAVLVTGAMWLLRELDGLWSRPPTTIGPLKYSIEGKADEVRAEALGHRIRERYVALNRFFRDLNAQRAKEAEAGRGAGDVVVSLDGTPGLSREGETPLELNVQGVDFGRILGALRKVVFSTDQITGTVVAAKDGKDPVAVLNWPGAPKVGHLPGESAALMSFDAVGTEGELTTRIACAMIWAQAVTPETSPVRWVQRGQFCTWVTAALIWRDLVDVAGRKGRIDGDDLLRLRHARDLVEGLHAQRARFAEVYRLRAALISLDPAVAAEDAAIAEESKFLAGRIQAGRTFDEAASDLADERERERQQELAAVVPTVEPRTLFDPSRIGPTLQAIIERPWTALPPEQTGQVFASAAAATGAVIVVGRENPLVGTGFVVGPGMVLTTKEVAEVMGASVTSAALGGFTLSADPRNPDVLHRVTSVSLHETPAGGLALLRVPTLADDPPRLELAPDGGAAAPGTVIGVVGYPVDPGAALLAPSTGPVERATGSRLAGLGRVQEGAAREGALLHDATTFPGHSGAPVIDMATGRVLAVHSAKGADGLGIAITLGEGMFRPVPPAGRSAP